MFKPPLRLNVAAVAGLDRALALRGAAVRGDGPAGRLLVPDAHRCADGLRDDRDIPIGPGEALLGLRLRSGRGRSGGRRRHLTTRRQRGRGRSRHLATRHRICDQVLRPVDRVRGYSGDHHGHPAGHDGDQLALGGVPGSDQDSGAGARTGPARDGAAALKVETSRHGAGTAVVRRAGARDRADAAGGGRPGCGQGGRGRRGGDRAQTFGRPPGRAHRPLGGAVQVVEQGLAVGVSLPAVGSHRPIENRLQVAEQLAGRFRVSRIRLAQHLGDHRAGRVDVRRRRERVARERLGARVRADARRIGMAEPGAELHQLRCPVAVDQDRPGREAAVHHVVPMGVRQALQRTADDSEPLTQRELGGRQQRGEARTGDPFLDQPDAVVIGDRRFGPDDVLVVQATRALRLGDDPLALIRCRQGQLLQRDVATEALILSLPDGAVAASGKLVEQGVVADLHLDTPPCVVRDLTA